MAGGWQRQNADALHAMKVGLGQDVISLRDARRNVSTKKDAIARMEASSTKAIASAPVQ